MITTTPPSILALALPRRRRHLVPALGLIALLLLSTGCRNSENPEIFHPWGWESAEHAKFHLNSYKHILVVRIDENYSTGRGPYGLIPHHFKATVVKSYKGEWKVSEKIAFVHDLDIPLSDMPASNSLTGELKFLFTNEHKDAEIKIDTGEFGLYREDLHAAALESVYPQTRR